MRSNGVVQDLRAPLEDGKPIQILTVRDKDDPDALYVLRHSSAHLLAEAVRRLYPGVKVAIGPPIDQGFYYDFEFPEPITEADLERIEAEVKREIAEGREWSREATTADEARARFGAEGETYKVELVDTAEGEISLYTQSHNGSAEFTDLCRGPHLQNAGPIKALKLTGLAGALLARRREEQAADPHLRHRVLQPGRPRRAPRAARGGPRPRPPPARRPARPLPLLRHLAGLAVLAPEGDGDLERARGPAPARGSGARLRRGADAADLRQVALGDLRPLGEVPRAHVHVRVREPHVRAQADELPRATRRSTRPARTATASCRCASPRPACCTATSWPGRCTACCACACSRRTTRTSSARPSRSRTRSSAASTSATRSTTSSGSRSWSSSRRGPRTSSAPTRSGTSPRRRSRRRSSAAGSRTP